MLILLFSGAFLRSVVWLLHLPAAPFWYPILQTILTLLLASIALEMANNPPQQQWHKVLWRSAFWLVALLIVCVALAQAFDQTDKENKNAQALKNLTKEVSYLRQEQSEAYKGISSIFSTNAAIDATMRLSVLQNERKKLSDEGDALKTMHELINPATVDLATARKEREIELARQENEKRTALIDAQIKAVEREQAQKEARRMADLNQRINEQNMAERDQFLASKLLPIFDYTIRTLDKALEQIAANSGEKRFSDFQGLTPTAYGSSFVSERRIISGTNFIYVGSNAAWRFQISTTGPLLSGKITPLQFNLPAINIISETTNGQSALTIAPLASWSGRLSRPIGRLEQERNIVDWNTSTLEVTQVLVKLTVPNGLNIDEQLSFTNYTSNIDKAIRRLIGAQDQQAPLPQKPH